MIRLLQIEWLKLKYNKAFWILSGMYTLGVTIICTSGMLLLEFLKSKGANFDGIDPTILPLYDFPDVWHNITYIATFLKVILGFIVVISIANESSYKTLRQNIIDGLSKKEFLASKILIIGVISIATTVLLFLLGLSSGLVYSHVLGWKYIFSDLGFLLAYGFEVFVYLTFALMIALLVRKAGLVIVGLLMYTVAFEPIVATILRHAPEVPKWGVVMSDYLPIAALNNLIQVPFLKYFFQEVHDYVALADIGVVLGWLVINIALSMLILNKKDL